MPSFNNRSKIRLSTCHKDLQLLFNTVIKTHDCSVLCGNRRELEQNSLYHQGKSRLKFPNSKHNLYPSRAVDVVPYPIDWKNTEEFDEFVDFVLKIAKELNIKVKNGREWSSLKDYPHFELI